MSTRTFTREGSRISIVTDNYTEIDLHCRIYHTSVIHPIQICYHGDYTYRLIFFFDRYHSLSDCVSLLKRDDKIKILSDLLSLIDGIHHEGYYNIDLDPTKIYLSIDHNYSNPILIDFREIVTLDCCSLEEQFKQYMRVDTEQVRSLINYLDVDIEMIDDIKPLGYIVGEMETGIVKYQYPDWRDGIDLIDTIAREQEIDSSFRVIYLIYDLYHRGLMFLPPPRERDQKDMIQILSIVVFMIGCRFMQINFRINNRGFDHKILENFELILIKNLRYQINRDLIYDKEDDLEKIDIVVKNRYYLKLS